MPAADATPEEKANAFAAKLKETTTKEVITNFNHVVYKSFVNKKGEDFSQKPYQFERDRGPGSSPTPTGRSSISSPSKPKVRIPISMHSSS